MTTKKLIFILNRLPRFKNLPVRVGLKVEESCDGPAFIHSFPLIAIKQYKEEIRLICDDSFPDNEKGLEIALKVTDLIEELNKFDENLPVKFKNHLISRVGNMFTPAQYHYHKDETQPYSNYILLCDNFVICDMNYL